MSRARQVANFDPALFAADEVKDALIAHKIERDNNPRFSPLPKE